MKKIVLDSPAKLNLYLNVLGKRTDGFHEIETVFERINLCDQISLVSNSRGYIRVKCLGYGVPAEKDNLAFKAAGILKKDFSVKDGVTISIKKRIPVGSGLGGASSNAATVLLGLNRLWGLNSTVKYLLRYARSLGSDVPFFVSGYRFALGKGRGDRLVALRGLGRLWHLVVVPPRQVLTRSVYQGLDLESDPRPRLEGVNSEPAKRAEGLTNTNNNAKMFTPLETICSKRRSLTGLLQSLREKNLTCLSRYIYNTLETVTEEQYPIVTKIKDYLKNLGIDAIGMSGSGAAVFAILRTRKEALKFKSDITNGKDWQIFVVRTC